MIVTDFILFLFAALFSEIGGTIAGFGSSTLFLPLALLFFDFKTALVLVAFAHIFGNLGRIGFFRQGLDGKLLLKFSIPSVLLTILGALLVVYLPQELLKLLLGIFLVIYSAVFIWEKNIKLPANNLTVMLGGGLSGFMAGIIGTGGALRSAFLGSFNLPKEKYIATSAITAILVDATRIPIYISQGFFSGRFMIYLPFLFVIAIIGSYLGKKALDHIPKEKFRTIIFGAVFIIGISFIYNFYF